MGGESVYHALKLLAMLLYLRLIQDIQEVKYAESNGGNLFLIMACSEGRTIIIVGITVSKGKFAWGRMPLEGVTVHGGKGSKT
eukprot:6079902-Ditylum_brightwellii.AAC.3